MCYGVAALWAGVGLQWAMDRLPTPMAARWRVAAVVLHRVGDHLADWPVLRSPGHLHALGTPRGLAALTDAAIVVLSASAGGPANDRSGATLPTGLPPLRRRAPARRLDVNLRGLVFDNHLFDPLARQRALDRFVAAAESPVFLLPDADLHPTGRGHYGFLLGEGTTGTVLVDRRPVDRWERSRRNGLLSTLR